MRNIFLFANFACLFLVSFNEVKAQTNVTYPLKEVDLDFIRNQTIIGIGNKVGISDDGKFCWYVISNSPKNSMTLVLKEVKGNWQKEIEGISNGYFTKDSKLFIFSVKDSLHFLELGKEILTSIPEVESYKIINLELASWQRKMEYLIYKAKKSVGSRLKIRKLENNHEMDFGQVENFVHNGEGSNVLLLKKEASKVILQLISLHNFQLTEIYNDSILEIRSIILDKSGFQVSFCARKNMEDNEGYEVWHYRKGMMKAQKLADKMTKGIAPGLNIAPSINFSSDGRYIYLTLNKNELRNRNSNAVKVNVWNFMDAYLQSVQLARTDLQKISFSAVISTIYQKTLPPVVQITKEFETIIARPNKGDYVLVECDSSGDRYWLTPGRVSKIMVSLIDGSRSRFKLQQRGGLCTFSPEGKYLIYQDKTQGNRIFTFNLKSGVITPIENSDDARFIYKSDYAVNKYTEDNEYYTSSTIGIAAWLEGDKGVLLYDDYDIWQLDFSGKNAPINITNGLGKKEQVRFRLINDGMIVSPNQQLLLTAFNLATKYNGFYSVHIGNKGSITKLTMGPYTYFHAPKQLPPNAWEFVENMPPVKALNQAIWIVKRHTIDEAPNYFYTEDFRTFTALTSFRPHEGYNWPTAELINFPQSDSIGTQGILYKPANFDISKQYPVIILFYRHLSHRLYEYPTPFFIDDANIDVVWFTSRGYLVFTPDIYFTRGKGNIDALNAIQGAALHLSKFPFVDKNKIGLSAHSTAGGFAYHIIANSSLFAAAYIGAGVSDMISSSLQLAAQGIATGTSRQSVTESGFGFTLWENPEAYLNQSPIMKADKVTTPTLIFHCRKDGALPWEQGVEMFLALRRLGKKVWMLEYDDGNHGLSGADAEDLTIRATQFFDHFLLNKLPPRWMSKGIPARLKGIDLGLNLDSSFSY